MYMQLTCSCTRACVGVYVYTCGHTHTITNICLDAGSKKRSAR